MHRPSHSLQKYSGVRVYSIAPLCTNNFLGCDAGHSPKNVHISSIVISGGCVEVLPVALDDMY